jgi:hypothetical protein
MTSLSALKFTTAKKPSQVSPVQMRRMKIRNRIDEQIKLAQAMQAGEVYQPNRTRTTKNALTGERISVVTAKRLSPWWFVLDNGKIGLSVRYGAYTLELSKGRYTIEISNMEQLLPTLQVLRKAVDDGELDSAIDAASGSLRQGFAK